MCKIAALVALLTLPITLPALADPLTDAQMDRVTAGDVNSLIATVLAGGTVTLAQGQAYFNDPNLGPVISQSLSQSVSP